MDPFHVIDASKLQKKSDDGEEPKKMTFEENFEKEKQKRIQEGKSFEKAKRFTNKKLQEKEQRKELWKGTKYYLDSAEEKTFSGYKTTSKDKKGFKKQKKSKFKKADSRTGRDRGMIFKSPKSNSFSVSNKTNTVDRKRHNKYPASKHIKFDESGNISGRQGTASAPKPTGELRNRISTTPNHVYFD